MTRTQYYTATSIDGFIADEHNSLDWLFEVESNGGDRFAPFFSEVGAFAMGATTYEWVLAHEKLLETPDKWFGWYGERPCWVFTHRDLPNVPGADIRFVSGDVAPVHTAMVEAAAGRNVWLVGGGELVGSFADRDLLDEIILGVAPVTLGAGAPLLPRRLPASRLTPGGGDARWSVRPTPVRRAPHPLTYGRRAGAGPHAAQRGRAPCRGYATGGPRMTAPSEAVGRVLGTADATPLTFWVAVAPGSYLQLDDVVVTHRQLPDGTRVAIAGVVTQVRARHEGAQFESDVFLIADGTLPAEVQESAEITTTRVDPEVYVPPRPGVPVHRATDLERAIALYFDRMERQVPAGLGRDGEPVFINADFLDGTRGAHVSISGISGVATKTSFATWLLYSLFRSPALGAEAVNTKALIFNVKGEDLLLLDHANLKLTDEIRAQYAKLGLPAEAFGSVGVYAPPRIGDRAGTPDVASRTTG
ncbi:MAG: dihydrofolate reductase family protein, partial [Micromonosporaceae bacterium]